MSTELENEIIALIRAGITDADVAANGDGGRMEIDVVSDAFASLSRVQKQQRVYACIDKLIKQGALHAVTIKASTRAEKSARP